MAEICTVATQIPQTWYAHSNAWGQPEIWDASTDQHKVVAGEIECRNPALLALHAALPRMQWGYLSDDEITPCASEAQATVRCWLRRHDNSGAFVVHRIGEGDWVDDRGLCYSIPTALVRPLTDIMATTEGASYWLHRAAQMAAAGEPDADAVVTVLRCEARRNGHASAAG